jgi:glycosyl hydrolase family 106( putative alpha-L-rhamnosidase)
MAQAGWGGFFIHARHGLETPYLGAEYMAAMEVIVAEAHAQNLRVWLYDEHPFPSGAAGGLVGAERSEFRHRVLAAHVHTRLTPIEEAVAYFELELDPRSGVPVRATRVEPGGESSRASRFLHFHAWEMPVGHTWLANHGNSFIHGFPFTDLLNPAAVARFIDLTYVAHRDRLGEHFGPTLVGAFSDIPVYNWHYGTPHPSVPWTGKLPDRFRERYGYDLIDALASLIFDVGEYHAVRHDYWKLVSDLFVEAYTEQVAEWCRANGILYSAHYWGEEVPHWQVAWAGDVMHHFTYQDVVANDHILRNIDDPAGIKQAATVAEQLGKERVLTEIYALSGYNLTYEERKWIGEWAFVLGSNMLVPYIPSYSLRGRRKRDEPPSEFFQQPYWDDERAINDYFARLGYALCCGQRVVDVLVLQPLSTAWAMFRPGTEIPPAWRPSEDPYEGAGAELHSLGDAFRRTVDWLLAAHCDFHLGNERILAEHGCVEEGRLRVGLGSYELVIVPPSLTWSSVTLDLLRQYVDAGGRVIALPSLPSLVDGRPVAGALLPSETEEVEFSEVALRRAVREVATRRVGIAGAPDVLYQYRVDDETSVHLLFLVNTSIDTAYDNVSVDLFELPPENGIELWNMADGTSAPVASTIVADGRRLTLDFPPAGSHLVVSRPDAERDVQQRPRRGPSTRIALASQWKICLDNANPLVLDTCTLEIARERTEELSTWRAQEQLKRAGTGAAFVARFEFDVAAMPKQAFAVVEDVGRYDLVVNGVSVGTERARPWFDAHLLQVEITSTLREGLNQIELSGRVGIDTELEPIFLTGDFTVVGGPSSFRVERPADTVAGSNLTAEGYPFYVGRPVLSQRFVLPEGVGQVFLELDRLDAIGARVRLNGMHCGFLAWRPYRVDLTAAARAGDANELEIELATSLHNLFGPHHDRRGEVRHFVIDGVWMNVQEWTDHYFCVPVGVTGATVLAWPR